MTKAEFKPKFDIGDWIRNKKAYEGEGAKLSMDIKDDYYICGNSSNLLSQKADLSNKENIRIDDQDNFEKLYFRIAV